MINNLYYDADDAPSFGLEIDDDLLASALAAIYNRDFDVRREVSPDLFRGVAQKIDEAITEGIADETPDDDFVEALRHSGEVFAAFKTHRAQNDMAAKLLDSNGALKPFDRWLNDVLPIASHQCGSWLRTEYDTAVIRAHQAAEWQRFERDKDVLPNLKWVPSTSPNPGADHRIYWGTILPVDHPFWSRHRPGDRWNCQCSLASTDEPATGIKHEDAVDPQKNGPQKGLKDNPGKTGNLFGQDHPYYPESCSSCSFAGGLTNRLGMIFHGQKRDCNRCSKLLARLPEKPDEKMSAAKDYYNKLDKDKNYIKVEINDKGGVTATHIGHNEDTGKKEFFGNTMSGADLERECVRGLYNDGNWVELLDESKKAPDGNAYTALDMRLNNVLMDIKSITKPSENYSWSLFGKDKQLYKYNKRPDITETANSVCLYFHDPAYFSHDKMLASFEPFLKEKNLRNHAITLKHVFVVQKGVSEILQYDIPGI